MSFTEEELRIGDGDAGYCPEAWYMDDKAEDQRLPHKQSPNKPCPLEKLAALGVRAWKLDADQHETDPKLATIRKVRNYSWKEIISISKDTLPGYDEKIKMFYEEHIHDDEEIRYVLDGQGYFDVRDFEDNWIRILCKKGDMIVLPEGIYHRFTLDTQDYIKAMRLFVGQPIWTPFNRPQDEHPSRKKYLDAFASSEAVQASA